MSQSDSIGNAPQFGFYVWVRRCIDNTGFKNPQERRWAIEHVIRGGEGHMNPPPVALAPICYSLGVVGGGATFNFRSWITLYEGSGW